jgi:Rieske Fe-S protein
MDNRDHDTLKNWADVELAELSRGRADDAFLARVRTEHARRKRPVIAIIGVAAAIAASALLAFVLFPAAPRATPAPGAPIIADAEPIRPVQESIEPSAATLATLTRLNAGGDLDSLVLSRADCVAWTRTVNPLGR